MVRLAPRVRKAVRGEIGRELARDVAGTVVAQESGPVVDRDAIDARLCPRQTSVVATSVAAIVVVSVQARM